MWIILRPEAVQILYLYCRVDLPSWDDSCIAKVIHGKIHVCIQGKEYTGHTVGLSSQMRSWNKARLHQCMQISKTRIIIYF